jgi:hypothetical protein
MLTAGIVIFMSIAVLVMAMRMADERRKHKEWRESWEDGKSKTVSRLKMLK